MRIQITGWESGFRKVQMTLVTQELLDYSLSEAKRLTDAVLDGETVHLEVDESIGSEYARRLTELGAKVLTISE